MTDAASPGKSTMCLPSKVRTTKQTERSTVIPHGQGRLDEARVFFDEALRIYRTLLGGDQPDVAEALSDVAGVLTAQGRLEEARVSLDLWC
jgi:hypothetical protein